MIVCESCSESRYNREFNVNGRHVTSCRSCRRVRRAIADELRAERQKCVDCKQARVNRSTKSRRCYDCAMVLVRATYDQARERRTMARKVKEAEKLDVAKVQRSPSYYRIQVQAQAEPEKYFEVAPGEWWRKEFKCQGRGCGKYIMTWGRCYECATKRTRLPMNMPLSERQQFYERAS